MAASEAQAAVAAVRALVDEAMEEVCTASTGCRRE